MKELISYMYYLKFINRQSVIYMALDRAKIEVLMLYQLIPLTQNFYFHYILVVEKWQHLKQNYFVFWNLLNENQ
jgi:hypothetical protein